MDQTEDVLTNDPVRLREYHLLNPARIEMTCFHLNNMKLKRELKVFVENNLLNHLRPPKYLGATFDTVITFMEQFTKTATELKTHSKIPWLLLGFCDLLQNLLVTDLSI